MTGSAQPSPVRRPRGRRPGADCSRAAAERTGGIRRRVASLLMWLLGWSLTVGGALHGLVFVLDVRPVNGLVDVPCWLVYLCLHLLVIHAGLKVLGHGGACRRAARERARAPGPLKGFARMARRMGIHYVGLVASTVVAYALLFFCWRWPFRLTHVGLAMSETHFLAAPHDPWRRATWLQEVVRLDVAFVMNLVLLFAAIEAASLLRRLSLFRRRPVIGTAAAGAVAVAFFVLFFPACAKVRGFLKSREMFRHPAEVAIRYDETGEWSGHRGFLVSTNNEYDVPRGGVPPTTTVVQASDEQIIELLEILADGGFFEMEGLLFPYSTSGGVWKTLEVTGGCERHHVASYAETPQGRKFDAIVGKLMRAIDLKPP